MQREKLKYLTKIGHTSAVDREAWEKVLSPWVATKIAYSERPILGYI
jgi:hypothetical protein